MIPPGDRDRSVSGQIRVTHFGNTLKAQLEIFHIFHFCNAIRVFCIKNSIVEIFDTVFAEKSCPTAKSFLLKKHLASGQTSFPLLNPDCPSQIVGTSTKCKETETCPFSSPGPTSFLNSGRQKYFPTTVKKNSGSANKIDAYDGCNTLSSSIQTYLTHCIEIE